MKTPDRLQQESLLQATRRQFLQTGSAGLGAVSLASGSPAALAAALGHESPTSAAATPFSRHAGQPPVVQRVIHLHMVGGPSQLELFDYKPLLRRWSGSLIPADGTIDRCSAHRRCGELLGPQCEFSQHGESGTWVSNHLPAFSQVVDSVSFLHAVQTNSGDHAKAQLAMLCRQAGSETHSLPEKLSSPPESQAAFAASLGAFMTAGWGRTSANLPGHVVLFSGGRFPAAGPSAWGHGPLPADCQGIRCRSNGDPVLFLSDPTARQSPPCGATVPTISRLRRQTYERIGHPLGLANVAQDATTYAMQAAAAEATDLAQETREVQQLYGITPGPESFANHCLLARRLLERGVRYVQLFDHGWDTHGGTAADALRGGFQQKCREIDRPMAALLTDLARSGMLADTLVIWGGEFGRSPMRSTSSNPSARWVGRDHHPAAFTMWLAGAGIRPGVHYGQTDELGLAAVENPVSVGDLQATMLRLAGLDAERAGLRWPAVASHCTGAVTGVKQSS